MSDQAGEIVELFSSIQGEGPLVGIRQVFLRFYGCNLSCAYCDTENTVPPVYCLMERTPGRRDFVREENPVSIHQVLGLLGEWQKGWPGIHHSISITGGEPLMWHELLLEWLPPLRELFPIYLETNGVLHTALSKVIPHVDYISMDIKLPSTCSGQTLWGHHRDFLRIAAQKNIFVKIVVDNGTDQREIIEASEIITEIDRNIPLILQPVTLKTGNVGITPLRMLELQETASNYLAEVRVIPQTHRFIGHL